LAKDYKKRYQNVNQILEDFNDLQTKDQKLFKPFLGFNDRPAKIPKYFEMYPSRFTKFFKKFNL
jgi:hypothetical protein